MAAPFPLTALFLVHPLAVFRICLIYHILLLSLEKGTSSSSPSLATAIAPLQQWRWRKSWATIVSTLLHLSQHWVDKQQALSSENPTSVPSPPVHCSKPHPSLIDGPALKKNIDSSPYIFLSVWMASSCIEVSPMIHIGLLSNSAAPPKMTFETQPKGIVFDIPISSFSTNSRAQSLPAVFSPSLERGGYIQQTKQPTIV